VARKRNPNLVLVPPEPKVPKIDSRLLAVPSIRSSILKRRTIKPEDLPNYVEAMMSMMAPYHLAAVHQQLLRGAVLGEKSAIDNIMQMYGMKGSKAAPVFQNNIQLNQTGGSATYEATPGSVSFDSIVRRIAEKKEREMLESGEAIEVNATPVL